MRPFRLARLLPILILAVILAGCATVTSVPTRQQTAQAQHARELRESGDYANAAQAYAELANGNHGSSDYFRLRAAEAWRQAGAPKRASQALDEVTRKRLSAQDQLRYDLLAGEIALTRGQLEQALDDVPASIDELPTPLRQRALKLRAGALADSGKPWQAARTRAKLDPLLTGTERQDNARKTVQLLAGLGADALKQRATHLAADDPMLPWVRQALDQLGVAFAANAPELTQPLGTLLPGGQRTEGYRMPHQVALLLPLSGPLAAAGNVIRQGFFAAYFQTDHDTDAALAPVRVYDSAGTADGAREAYQEAVADGATLVVGPLSRHGVGAILDQNDAFATGVSTSGDHRGERTGTTGEPNREPTGTRRNERNEPTGIMGDQNNEPSMDAGARLEQRGESSVAMLALNRPEGDALPPPHVTEFALRPEAEGVQVARHMRNRGLRQAVVMASNNGFAQRAVKAFESQFEGNDGVVAASLTLNPTKVDYAAQIRSLRDALQPGTGIFISMRPEQARLLMPQLHLAGVKAPVFATSQVYDGHDNPIADGDLDGVEFCDAPWLFNAQPGLPPRDAIAGMLPAARGTSARLFAFGMDAWSLVPYLHRLRSHPGSYLAGASGRLSEDDFGRVHRTLMWARFANGVARPLAGSLEVGHLKPAASSSAAGMPALGPLPASQGSSPAPASSVPDARD